MSTIEHSSVIAHRYREALAGSSRQHARAVDVLAGAAAHDSWALQPFAPVWRRAEGSYKWDIDGRRYIDYWMGHGALLLGHSPHAVLCAVREQLDNGLHFGGLHPLMLEWAEWVARLVPSAQRVRFTNSGTEATLLALRVARAYTGRPVVLRIDGHYHGWHDEALAGTIDARSGGLRADVLDAVAVFGLDLEAIEARLMEGDVAGLIIEPGGGSCGMLPYDLAALHALRRLTQRHGTLLIFDEVVSGFRYAPGGVQALSGVLPDVTVLAKILCGGFAGGALAGSAQVMNVFGDGMARGDGSAARVLHAGTFNSNPVAAVAGIATLSQLHDGSQQALAARQAQSLAQGVNAAAARAGMDVRMFALSSLIHVVIGAVAARITPQPSPECFMLVRKYLPQLRCLRLALLCSGVDMHVSHGWVSTVHSDAVIAETVDAFARAFDLLQDDPLFSGDAGDAR